MASQPTVDRTRVFLVALMWIGALGGSWALYRAQRNPPTAVVTTTQPANVPPSKPPALSILTDATPNHFRINRRHTGRSPHVGPARGTVRWQHDLESRVTAQPVVGATGNVYVGTHAGIFWALNSEGIVLWKRDLGARIFAAALVGPNGHLYVGTDGKGFYSLDGNGKTRFQLPLNDATGIDIDADTAPTLAPDGRIRFAAGKTLHSVDTEGRIAWTFDAGDKIFSSPTLDDDSTTYVGAQDDHLYAIDAAGKLRFRYRTAGDIDVSPVLDSDGTLYFGSDDQHVYAVTSAGALRWATKLDGYVRGALALGADGSLLATHSGPRGALIALDRATGSQRFRFAFGLTDSTDTGVRGGALVDHDGAIYVGADDDYLYSLSPDGKLRWAFAMGSDAEASTTLTADGTLYAISAKGVLYALGGNE